MARILTASALVASLGCSSSITPERAASPQPSAPSTKSAPARGEAGPPPHKPVRRHTPRPLLGRPGVCRAVWYGEAMRGNLTASGRRFNPDEYTAAHRTLPFGTRLLVRYRDRHVTVTITDRGPQNHSRCLDLSSGAFQQLAPLSQGIISVTWRRLA